MTQNGSGINFYFFDRKEEPGKPAGVTVSKRRTLPEGDFEITEYGWSRMSLWFVDEDEFTADERQVAYLGGKDA